MEKLKQRVVSSSSRVIASLQQAAAVAAAATPSPTSGRLAAATAATAHLTEQEREILHEVFRKEEQFQRETIKQMARPAQPSMADSPEEATLSLFGSQAAGSSAAGSPLSGTRATPTSHPRPKSTVPRECAGRARELEGSRECQAGRRANSACSGAPAGLVRSVGGSSPANEQDQRQQQQCRICRKQIPSCEPSHLCSTCNQFICDDCASYSASDQHWMCSSCRRRATKPAIPADALRELGLNQDSSAVRRMTLRLNQAELKQALAGKKDPPSCPRRSSKSEITGAREQQQVAPSSAASSASGRDSVLPERPAASGSSGAQDERLGVAGSLGKTGQQASAIECREALIDSASVEGDTKVHSAPIGQVRKQVQSKRPGVETLVTASSEQSLSGSQLELQRANRIHSVSAQGSAATGVDLAGRSGGSQLFQQSLFPADQIHLRRLSDQSNLVRRSSIISANNQLNQFAPARNRSHSNIDTAAAQYYQYYPSPPPAMLLESFQQRRPSCGDPTGAWQQQRPPLPGSGSRDMAALITSYARKRRRRSDSADKVHSDSSSDTNEPAPDSLENPAHRSGLFSAGTGQMSTLSQPLSGWPANQSDKPQQSGYSPPAQALSSHFLELSPNQEDILCGNQSQQHYQHYHHRGSYCSALELSLGERVPSSSGIPSVSVSEFSSSQQRLLHRQQLAEQQQQQQMASSYQPDLPILNTPSQINLAIQQAIQRQQRRQSQTSIQQPTGTSMQLACEPLLGPRRASSGRVLPRIPGEQSRSLLELPQLEGAHLTASGDGSTTGGAGQTSSTLDLPCLSPTIRRASAPEGQNIKIVVDDMDTSSLGGVLGATGGISAHSALLLSTAGPNRHQLINGKQVGQLYERLVLYRDDSLDPSTNLAHGFGLQLMGGKIMPNEDKLQACVTWVLPGGPADKAGIRPGDRVIEWDGKCLVNMTYEQVAEAVESSANIAELLVKPATRLQAQPNYVRSQRRLSQQTERDLRRHSAFEQQIPSNGFQQPMDVRLQWSQQQQQPVITRPGTGRRLPQIPGSKQLQDSNLSSLSTGRLEQINGYTNNARRNSNHLAASRNEQQSHSTGELYSSQVALGSLQPHVFSTNALGYSQAPQNELNNSAAPDKLTSCLQHPNNSEQYARYSHPDEICGLIGLQVNVDERVSQLEISILSAINIAVNPAYEYYVRVKILPENNRFKACSTQPSSDLNWKETFIFQNFPIQQIPRMALEIGIWTYEEAPRLSTQIAQPICEALIPIQSARERNIDFWPLRAPPTSPQVRRKSLNNLIETHQSHQELNNPKQEYHQKKFVSPRNSYQQDMLSCDVASALGKSLLKIQAHTGNQYPNELIFTRERSSSNRNLPVTNKVLHNQPRRASDEVASNSSHMLSNRAESASGRRSISVINVGDGLLSRPSSRLGSQSNILKLRRDSTQQFPSHSPIFMTRREDSPTTSVSNQTPPVGTTPSGRKSSLAGINSMTGYRSQKNSQSGSTDQDSPMKTINRARAVPHQSTNLTDTRTQRGQHKVIPNENSSIQPEKTSLISTNQRKGSFALQTFRKLKRTMSLNKGHDKEGGSNQDSRRSSSSSGPIESEVGEDLAVARRLLSHQNFVGRLKISLIITKGQLEVDIICANGLKFSHENSLGVYVKLYLKERSKTNKRKTRLVQPCESPQLKQVIKYDASLVDNKSLDVSVWQKQGGLKGKNPIGFTEIQLRELNLEVLQTSWYNLRPLDVICNSSIED